MATGKALLAQDVRRTLEAAGCTKSYSWRSYNDRYGCSAGFRVHVSHIRGDQAVIVVYSAEGSLIHGNKLDRLSRYEIALKVQGFEVALEQGTGQKRFSREEYPWARLRVKRGTYEHPA